MKAAIFDFAFKLGQVVGMVEREGVVRDFLLKRGVSEKDIKEFSDSATKIANAFYAKEGEKT